MKERSSHKTRWIHEEVKSLWILKTAVAKLTKGAGGSWRLEPPRPQTATGGDAAVALELVVKTKRVTTSFF